MKEFLKRNKFNLIVIFFYAIITVIILLFHECGRDEAQAWLIAKNLNIIQMLKQITYEGHPVLWYLILHPFARIGFPYITTKIISWIISVVSVWFILWKSPLDKKMKILFICTSPFIYLYPSISRSYCLIPLAIAIVSYYYNKRHETPIKYMLSILLLANTHVVLYGMVWILLVFFFFEEFIRNRKTNSIDQNKKVLISLIIIIIGLTITIIPIILSVLQNTDVNLTNNEKLSTYSTNQAITKMFATTLQMLENIFIGNIIPIICIAILIAYEIKYHSKNAIILIISALFHIFVHSFVYSLADQRDVIFIFLIIFIYWIQKEKKQKNKYQLEAKMLVIILLLLNIVNGLNFVVEELKYEYSASYETAEYIENNIDTENSIIVCSNMPYASAVIPYINKNIFWSPQTDDYFSFVTWNEDFKKGYSVKEMQQKIAQNFDSNKKVYFLYTYNFDEDIIQNMEETGYITKVFSSNMAKRENYIIYEVKIEK